MYSDSSHTVQAAIEGQGIALARTSLLGNDLRNGVLIRLFGIEVPSPRKYFLVYPPRLAESPKLIAFRQWLFDEVAAERPGPPPGSDGPLRRRKPVPAGPARTTRHRR